MLSQSSFLPEYSILNLQLWWKMFVWFWWCIFQIVLKQLTNTLFIFILVSTILKTGVNYCSTFLLIFRKHPGNVLFLTKWCWCLPASTVSADYFHFRQMVHWQSRSNLKLCYQAVLPREAIWILEFCWISQATAACLWHLLLFFFFFFLSSQFFVFSFFFPLAISRLSFVGLCSCLLSLDQVSSLNGIAMHITLWAVKSSLQWTF